MNTHPTPAQAKVLRALIENPAVRIVWRRYNAHWIGPSSWKVKDELGTLRSPTVRALVREGWLQEADDRQDGGMYEISPEARILIDALAPEDFENPVQGMTAVQVMAGLRAHFAAPAWWLVEEINDPAQNRRIDALALRLHTGKPAALERYLTLVAIEVKVDRGDFLQELADPTKREPWIRMSTHYLFAAPAGLLKPAEIPRDLGLMEIHEGHRITLPIKPQETRAMDPDWRMVAAMARSHLKRK